MDDGPGGGDLSVGIKCLDDVTGDTGQRLSFGCFGEGSAVVGGELAVKQGEAGGDGAEHVLIAVAEGDQFEELFQADVALAFEGLHSRKQFKLGDAYAKFDLCNALLSQQHEGPTLLR